MLVFALLVIAVSVVGLWLSLLARSCVGTDRDRRRAEIISWGFGGLIVFLVLLVCYDYAGRKVSSREFDAWGIMSVEEGGLSVWVDVPVRVRRRVVSYPLGGTGVDYRVSVKRLPDRLPFSGGVGE